MTIRLGWFTTGRGPGSRRLLATVHDEIAAGRLDAEIAVVFCNREPGQDPQTDKLMDQVRGYGLPLICLSTLSYRRERGERPARPDEPLPQWRRDFDREAMRLLEPHPFDIGVLAGYMLIATDVMCDRYNLLNLHPAAPDGPSGTWQEVIWWLIERRADHSGVRIHLATTELDMGPTVTYCTYPIRGAAFDDLWREIAEQPIEAVKAEQGEENPLFKEIRRHGVARELPLIVETLRAFAEGRLRFEDKRIVDEKGREAQGHDLTQRIEESVAAAQS